MGETVPTFCAFDLETTGFIANGEIVQLGAVRFGPDGTIIDRLHMYVHPKSAIPIRIVHLTGTSPDAVAWARPAHEAVAIFKAFCAGDILVGHNAVAFDQSFIVAIDPTLAGRLIIDTLLASRLLMPGVSHKLSDLTTQFGIEHTAPHQAWSDAEATAELLCHLVAKARALSPSARAAMAQSPRAQNPSVTSFLNDLVAREAALPLSAQRMRATADRHRPPRTRATDSKPSAAPTTAKAPPTRRTAVPGRKVGTAGPVPMVGGADVSLPTPDEGLAA